MRIFEQDRCDKRNLQMSSSETAKYIDKYEVLGEVGRGAMGGVYGRCTRSFGST